MVMTDADLSFARDCVTGTLKDRAELLARAATQDGQGGFTYSELVSLALVECRIAEVSGKESFIGDMQVTDEDWIITVHYDWADVLYSAQVVRTSEREYEVRLTNQHQDLRTAGRAIIRRVK